MTDRGSGAAGTGDGVASVAVLLMLLANLTFALVDTSTKWLLGAGYIAIQLAFLRYAVQLAITTSDLFRRGPEALSGVRPLLPVLVLRAAILVLATIVNFFMLQFLTLTVASSIMFTAPIIVCLLSWPLLGEPVGPFRLMAIGLGFCGVLVIIRPFGEELNWAAAVMLVPATGLALYSILTRKLAGDVNPSAMQFILGLTGTAALAPFAAAHWVSPARPLDLALMLGLGTFAWAGHELLIRAHRMAPANYLMPFSYSYLIYMSLSGLIVFGDAPDAWTLAGAGMIAVSGLSIWWRERAASLGARTTHRAH